MLVTEQWMEQMYFEYNRLIFHDEMPKCDFNIDYNRDRLGNAHCIYHGLSHCAGGFTITLSNYYDSPEWVKKSIFLHEMLHIYDFSRPDYYKRLRKDIHGEAFFKPTQRKIETLFNIPCNLNTRYIRAISTVNTEITNRKIPYQICTGLTEAHKMYGYLPRIENRWN